MSTPSPTPPIDLLLNLVPTHSSAVLQKLCSHPFLAPARDRHGYSLVHAAASYAQLDLLRALVQTYNVSVDIVDEDDETPLFAAESVEVARCLVEELGADVGWRNAEGLTAEEKIEGEGEWPLVAAYLREAAGGAPRSTSSHPPPLPQNVKIDLRTVEEAQPDDLPPPDPEFRRRIEELAAREDFQSEEGQRQLRELVTEAVAGMREDERDVRRRVE